MRTHLTQCPICKSASISLFKEIKDHSISKEQFTLKRCNSCDFVFTSNPPQESQAGPYYQSEDYISHSNTNKDLISKVYKIVRSFMFGVKERMIHSYSSGKRVLDYGSGTGFFLNYLKEKGYQVQGVEIDDKARNFAKTNFGLSVHTPNELLSSTQTEQFDAISLWHVLEHLYDPLKYLQKFNTLLTQKGVLIIAVPNLQSFDAQYFKTYWAAYDVPRHLWHFSPSTLAHLAGQAGFDCVTHKRLPFDPFYNALLSAKYQGGLFWMPKGFILGLISFLQSLVDIKRSSSVVYILKKKLS
jgi:2-polyprenyl-3-methyl-5-hydroxy-6-metoxy-1,4-benzoquinol methylase